MIEVVEDKNSWDDVIGISIYSDGRKVREFADLNGFIIWLFRFRCVGLDVPCHKVASDISHIETGHDDSDWRKLVLHCRYHHELYHSGGVSDDAIEKLIERRAEYLETIGRSEYI